MNNNGSTLERCFDTFLRSLEIRKIYPKSSIIKQVIVFLIGDQNAGSGEVEIYFGFRIVYSHLQFMINKYLLRACAEQ